MSNNTEDLRSFMDNRPKEGTVRVFDADTFFDIDINIFTKFFPDVRLPYNAFRYVGTDD